MAKYKASFLAKTHQKLVVLAKTVERFASKAGKLSHVLAENQMPVFLGTRLVKEPEEPKGDAVLVANLYVVYR